MKLWYLRLVSNLQEKHSKKREPYRRVVGRFHKLTRTWVLCGPIFLLSSLLIVYLMYFLSSSTYSVLPFFLLLLKATSPAIKSVSCRHHRSLLSLNCEICKTTAYCRAIFCVCIYVLLSSSPPFSSHTHTHTLIFAYSLFSSYPYLSLSFSFFLSLSL